MFAGYPEFGEDLPPTSQSQSDLNGAGIEFIARVIMFAGDTMDPKLQGRQASGNLKPVAGDV